MDKAEGALPSEHLYEVWRLWLRLRHTKGLNRARICRLLDAYGDPETIFGTSARAITGLDGFTNDMARALLEGHITIDLERELDLIDKFGARLVLRDDEDYPENLKSMENGPALLYLLGNLEKEDRFAVTIVGTRSTTGYGLAACEQVAGVMADAGLTVTSGLARGIDMIAHQTALKRGRRTLAVVANGLSRVYPPENESLAWKIRNSGAILSEYGMETIPDRFNFPERNEILAGMGLATIVIEAPVRSGALITARAALEYGRPVYAIPGDVTRANSRGCNELIREGAGLICEGAHVLEDMHDQLKDLLKGRKKEAASEKGRVEGPTLSLEESQVLEIVRRDASHFDDLYEKARCAGTEINAAKLSTVLLQLELKGRIRQAPGKMFLVNDDEEDDDDD